MERKTGVYRNLKRAFQTVLQYSRGPNRLVDLRLCVERVTGIEPAWPAWKAWDSKRHLGCSGPGQADVVPSVCLSATHGGRKSGASSSLAPPPVESRGLRMQLRPRQGGARGPATVPRCRLRVRSA